MARSPTATKVIISAGGGGHPVWRSDGREIYYWRQDELVAAALANTPSLAVTTRTPLFRRRYAPGAHANYDVSPDGKQFVTLSGPPATRVAVAVNLLAAER